MRWIHLSLAVAFLASCEPAVRQPPKRPNTELIAGGYERHPPDKPLAIQFNPDGSYRIAKEKGQLESSSNEGEGTYTVDGDTLTLEATKGMCSEAGQAKGTYKVVLSKIGVRFTKVDDSCERRSHFDGQTWWRIH
ncbi:MAG TPA: hypothetical protein VGM39_12020 [Kofleriaceae bacterium]